jgi:hypothetical protein
MEKLMHAQKLLPLALACTILSTTGCQLVVSPFLASAKKPQPSAPPKTKPQPKSLSSDEVNAYQQAVRLRFEHNDFAWIDAEAKDLRVKKERLPGGYFKLRALYKALEAPLGNDEATDNEWQAHIARLESWIRQNSRSVTAKVGLGHAWKNFAWHARGNGYSETVSAAANRVFADRLAAASKVLEEASSLDERCPEWYVATLWVGIGQGWERSAFDRVFYAGVELEPNYYYLYAAKATYLLPRWYGEEGESEQFAEDLTFMNTHQQARPKLLEGFQAIEKLYGTSPQRLNQACQFAIGSEDHQMVADLFSRVGDNYDPEVWRSRKNFEMFRQSAFMMAKADKDKANAGLSSPKTR